MRHLRDGLQVAAESAANGPVPFGIEGLEVSTPDHLCAFYRGPAERDELLIAYLRAGLDRGECCFCVVDSTDPEAVQGAIASEGEAPPAAAEPHLQVRGSEDTYFRDGEFSPERMLEFWDERVGSLLTRTGAPLVRWAGEMTWALRDRPGVELDKIMELEAHLNRFIPKYPQIVLCLYDLNQFHGDVIVDVLRTHPRVVFGTMIVENPYFEALENATGAP